jgi:hypothetical protein
MKYRLVALAGIDRGLAPLLLQLRGARGQAPPVCGVAHAGVDGDRLGHAAHLALQDQGAIRVEAPGPGGRSSAGG